MYSKPEYGNLRSTFRTIYAEGGLLRFWKGLAPRMLRIVCEYRVRRAVRKRRLRSSGAARTSHFTTQRDTQYMCRTYCGGRGERGGYHHEGKLGGLHSRDTALGWGWGAAGQGTAGHVAGGAWAWWHGGTWHGGTWWVVRGAWASRGAGAAGMRPFCEGPRACTPALPGQYSPVPLPLGAPNPLHACYPHLTCAATRPAAAPAPGATFILNSLRTNCVEYLDGVRGAGPAEAEVAAPAGQL